MVLFHGWRFIGIATLDLEEGSISCRHKVRENWWRYPVGILGANEDAL